MQSYMLNRAQVVFLKKRENRETEAQSRKKRGKVVNQHNQNWNKICLSCTRYLKDEFDYCSIICMVWHEKEASSLFVYSFLKEFLQLMPWYR